MLDGLRIVANHQLRHAGIACGGGAEEQEGHGRCGVRREPPHAPDEGQGARQERQGRERGEPAGPAHGERGQGKGERRERGELQALAERGEVVAAPAPRHVPQQSPLVDGDPVLARGVAPRVPGMPVLDQRAGSVGEAVPRRREPEEERLILDRRASVALVDPPRLEQRRASISCGVGVDEIDRPPADEPLVLLLVFRLHQAREQPALARGGAPSRAAEGRVGEAF